MLTQQLAPFVDTMASSLITGQTAEAVGALSSDTLTATEAGVPLLQRYLPFWAATLGARVLGLAQLLTGGLFTNSILTRDQIALLRADNVVSPGARGFADLGIQPVAAEAVIEDYLWRFRPSGQYDAIKQSAKNLRTH